MDAQALFNEFMGSTHGQNAAAALSEQGVSPEDANQYLQHAAEVAHAHVEEQGSGFLGAHIGRNFFAAFASGLVKGDGLLGSIKDGLEGALSGRLVEALASKVGLDPSTASGIAAAATPFITSFLHEKLGS